jgi:hypothetical protein
MTDFFKACGFRILETSEDKSIWSTLIFPPKSDIHSLERLKAETGFLFLHMHVLKEHAFPVQTSFKGSKKCA